MWLPNDPLCRDEDERWEDFDLLKYVSERKRTRTTIREIEIDGEKISYFKKIVITV